MLLNPSDLMNQQCDVLRSSSYTNPDLDISMSIHCELVALLTDVQQGTRYQDQIPFSTVQLYSANVDQWWNRWSQLDPLTSGIE
jgi:hypothetical protein